MGQSLGWLKAGLPRSCSPAAVLRLLPARRPRWQRPSFVRAVHRVSEVFFKSLLLSLVIIVAALLSICSHHTSMTLWTEGLRNEAGYEKCSVKGFSGVTYTHGEWCWLCFD